MNLVRSTCTNLGGIDRIWIAEQIAAEEFISMAANGLATIILERAAFNEIGLDSGSYQETLSEDDGGAFFQTTLSIQVRKDRFAAFTFERAWRNHQFLAVVKNNNGDFIIFKNLRLTRQKESGEFAPDFNGNRFQLVGNDWEPACHAAAVEAIFWFDTDFDGVGRFNPSLVFSGQATWNFANGTLLSGNVIDTDGAEQGLDGTNQMINIDAENDASGISEMHFRDNSITGTLRLDLVPNLTLGDFALNKIEAVMIGDWVNRSAVNVELRNNHLSTDAQRQLVQGIANRFNGTHSDLRIGLLNQIDALGNPQLPDQATIELALQLYHDYGIEIHLPMTEAIIQIQHD